MGAKDIIENSLVEDRINFADMANYALFRGRPVIDASELEDISPRSMLPGDGKPRERVRDVVKRWKGSAISVSVVIGIENQTRADPAMPFRMMVYDGTSYLRQIEEGERLSPVISIVYHIASEKWRAPRSVVEALGEIPEEIAPLVHDYGINLVDVATITREDVELFRDDFRYVADFVYQTVHGGDYIPPEGNVRSLEKVVRLSAEFTDDEAVLDALAEFRDSKEERNMSGWFTKIINENQEKGEIRRGEAAAVRMIRKNYPDEEIADITELSLERIRELRASVAV